MNNNNKTTDTYDVDEFDWGVDTPGIHIDDISPTFIEDALRAAINSNEASFGWRYLKADELKPHAGRLFRVKHFVPVEFRSFFEENYPAYTFAWDTSLYHHDHPCAHLYRELNELELLEDWAREDEQWLDLFGNPARNDKYKRNCLTLTKKMTAKDYLRDKNPSPRRFPFDMEKLCDPESSYGKINRVSVTDALYYLTLEDIGRILHTQPKRVMRALVMRHQQSGGVLNHGEQTYTIGEDGIVHQVNVKTGEYYTHPTLEAMFHQFSAKTAFGGVTWEIRKVGGDNFIMEFVGCPNEVCGDYVPFKLLKEQSWEEYTYNSVSVKKCLGWTWMVADSNKGKLRIVDTGLFEELRRYAACKQRTPRLKTEMATLARRLLNPRDIISTHGGKYSDVPSAQMSDYVEIATYIDVRHELEVGISLWKENAVMTTTLNAYYESGAMPKDFTVVSKVIDKVSKANVKVIKAVGDNIVEHAGHFRGEPRFALHDKPLTLAILSDARGCAQAIAKALGDHPYNPVTGETGW